MNILFISKYAKTSSSSVPTRQFMYSKALAKKGHNVMLVYSRSNGFSNTKFKEPYRLNNEEGVQTVMLNGPSVDFGMNITRLWSWILFEYRLFKNYRKFLKFEPDVIIVSSLSILTFVFGVYLKKRINKPLLLEIRDLYPLTLLEIGNFSKYNPVIVVLSMIEKFGYKNADAIISSLENSKQYFEKQIKENVDFHWLPTGFDDDLYVNEFDEESFLVIEKIRNLKKQGKFVVGYAGSIGTANALDSIFDIASDYKVKKREINFVIIGRGPKKAYYESNYQSSNVHFFNSINKKYLPLVLAECHLLINFWLDKPIYNYGISPNKWIDYMYSGRPLLLSLNSQSRIFEEAAFGWQVSAEKPDEIKKELIKISSLPSNELDEKGLNGKNYLFNKLNFEYLSARLESIIKRVSH